MLFITLLIVLAVIFGFIVYWTIMATLFVLGIVLVFWVVLIAMVVGDPYVGGVGGVFATGLTLWLWSVHNEKQSKVKPPGT